ncbi:MAG: M14 family metallopeptidase [Planctomycetota bacterium]
MSLAAILSALVAATQPPGDLLTTPERTDWQATATYDEVMELLRRIEAQSRVMHLTELGTTIEDRSIPLVVLANPPVRTSLEARAGDRAVVFAFGNIHAGEVCGKEGLLILTRQLALRPDHVLFKDLVIVFAPILNADGNERMSPDNRPGQVGPQRGMGQRANAQDLDLNRDWVKLESPEVRAVTRFLTVWDPHLTIDTHTTNGSRHRYLLTYEAPLIPAGHPGPIRFVRDVMLPEVSERFRRRYKYDTFFYGNFTKDGTAWQTYPGRARFGGPYRGLRGQMSILLEAYAYETYRNRVLAISEFVREILHYAAEERRRILSIATGSRRETVEAGGTPRPDDLVGLRHRVAAFAEPVIIKGFAEDEPDALQDRHLTHLGRYEATLSVRRPHGYILGPGLEHVALKLRQHGIAVQPWHGDATVEVYTVTAVERAKRAFQGHRLVHLEATSAVARRSFADSAFVSTAQPLGTLAVYLLEPQSEDGLATWNFLDDHLTEDGEYPVYRVRSPGDLEP